MTHRFGDSITFSPTAFPGLLLAQQGEEPARLPAASTKWRENRRPVSYLVALYSPSAPTLWQVYLSYLWQRQESALGKIPVGLHFTLSHHSTPSEGFFLKRCFLSCFTLKPLQRWVLTQAAAMEISDKFCFRGTEFWVLWGVGGGMAA